MKKKESIIVTISKPNFDKLSLSKQQMAVAQDVLDRVKFKQIIPSGGQFCSRFNEDDETKKLPQLSEKLKSTNTTCIVCAKGGLFMAYIGIVNNYEKPKLFCNAESIRFPEMEALSEIFSFEQLALIETAFEGTTFGWNVELTGRQELDCYDFNKAYTNDNDRLIAICKNIIKNKGTFIPKNTK